MKRVTYAHILTRAISDCEHNLAEQRKYLAKWEADASHKTEAIFFYDNIVKPIEQELETLMYLYEVETGTKF